MVASGVLFLLGGLASCSSPASNSGDSSDGTGTAVALPLTSSSSSASAAWVALAMGHLDDPVDTFWQLVTLPAGAQRWALATPPGVASNGGLVLSVGAGASVLAGFEPSQDLLVSPLAESSDQGATWQQGVLPGGLARGPDALASSGGAAIALLRQAGGAVVQSAGGLAGWRVLVTEPALARATSASGCGMEGLTAVGVIAGGTVGAPMVGSACAHGDRPGIFERSGTGWQSVGPVLPGVAGPTEVVRLLSTGSGATALVAAHSGGVADLIALWSDDGAQRWTVSSRLALAGGTVIATGSTADGGLVVTYRTTGGLAAAVIHQTTLGWQNLAPPPAGTAAVVATPEGGFDALVSNQAVLEVYALGGGEWTHTQSLSVPIQYGSSG